MNAPLKTAAPLTRTFSFFFIQILSTFFFLNYIHNLLVTFLNKRNEVHFLEVTVRMLSSEKFNDLKSKNQASRFGKCYFWLVHEKNLIKIDVQIIIIIYTFQ